MSTQGTWANKKPNNMFMIPSTLETDFFIWWCELIKPFVKLTKSEIKVMASFLKKRYELSKNITDPTILDTHLMSNDVRDKIIEECHITLRHFYVVMSNLRSRGIIVNNIINPKIIPNIRQTDNGMFQLLILLQEEEKKDEH